MQQSESALPLIAFSHLRWDFVYQRPQHLLSRLARDRPVIFVEEPVNGTATAHFERFRPCENVEVLRPHTPCGATGFHDDQLPYLQPLLGQYLRDFDIDRCDAWFYTPLALPLLATLQPRLVVYDCMDALAAFKDAPPQMQQRERALLKAADLVLCGGPSLYDAKRPLHPNVLCLPSAVDAAHYRPDTLTRPAQAGRSDGALNGINEGLPRPRLGFFGVIDERLDCDLIAALADADPTWQIVMVGPVVKIDVADLPARPNLHWFGQQTYEQLPDFLRGWDVCLLPFARNAATRFISPTKTLEYMAAEKPVVSTAITDVERLYRQAVAIAHDTGEFVAACRRALAESPEERTLRVQRMRALVEGMSWDSTVERIRHAMQTAAVRQRSKPFAAPLSELAPAVAVLDSVEHSPTSPASELRASFTQDATAAASRG